VVGLAVAAAATGRHDPGPTLAVRTAEGWETWWRADSAPVRWTAPHPAIANRIAWARAAPGLEWGQITLAGEGEAFRVRLIVARLDPGAFQFRLIKPPNGPMFSGKWDVGEAPSDAVLALNAGQFSDQPWGWVVIDGRERQPPGKGPLAPAIVLDSAGALRFVPPDSIDEVRGRVRLAFQSYPTLLDRDGEIPATLLGGGSGMDLGHRDSRLALGELRDGRIIVALTRFEALGGVLASLPLGLTTPEMAAVMGALGSRRAVLLDGGISSQLLIREGVRTHLWTAWRRVPLGLIAVPRHP
jgi:phosphodiester glycosidase